MTYAKKTFKIKSGKFRGEEYDVEDYWEKVYGKSWMMSVGNIAAIMYGMRSVEDNLPTDNKVLYGKIGCLGHLIHVNEIGEEVKK